MSKTRIPKIKSYKPLKVKLKTKGDGIIFFYDLVLVHRLVYFAFCASFRRFVHFKKKKKLNAVPNDFDLIFIVYIVYCVVSISVYLIGIECNE